MASFSSFISSFSLNADSEWIQIQTRGPFVGGIDYLCSCILDTYKWKRTQASCGLYANKYCGIWLGRLVIKKNDVGGETTSILIVLETDIHTSALSGTTGSVLSFHEHTHSFFSPCSLYLYVPPILSALSSEEYFLVVITARRPLGTWRLTSPYLRWGCVFIVSLWSLCLHRNTVQWSLVKTGLLPMPIWTRSEDKFHCLCWKSKPLGPKTYRPWLSQHFHLTVDVGQRYSSD